LKSSKNKDGGLTHTRLGLTEDIHTKDRLRNTFLLDCEIVKISLSKKNI
jgi:hypothetical protein